MDLTSRTERWHQELQRTLAALGPDTPLTGTPAGLTARSLQKVQPTEDGWRVVPDRRRRLSLNQVVLIGPPATDHTIDDQIQAVLGDDSSGQAFVLDAGRRSWPAVEDRFGSRAWPLAIDLTARGVILLRCAVTPDLSLGAPKGWQLTEPAITCAARRAQATQASRQAALARRDELLTRLQTHLKHLQPDEPHPLNVPADSLRGLAAALESATGPAKLAVLLAATDDLLSGTRRDGPRDFSLAHFTHSKERDDAATLLSEAGVPDEIAAALGLRRSPRIGVAGGIDVTVYGHTIELSLLDGPVLIRADQPALRLTTTSDRLVIVENLQAAETLAEHHDLRRRLGIIYTAGQPSHAARRLIAQLCTDVAATLLCPDADLGGVRIAAAILGALPADIARTVEICDPGAEPHRPQQPWPPDGATITGLRAALNGPAAGLARACLIRGYRVEQEETARRAAIRWLQSRDH